MDRGAVRPALPNQRPELRPLQNLRYQGPEPEHRVGAARGRGRAELPEYVKDLFLVIARQRVRAKRGPMTGSGGRPSTRWPASSVAIAPSAFTGCPAAASADL